MNTEREWYEDPGNIRAVLKWIDEGPDGPIEMVTVFDLLEKPWNWTREYVQAREAEARAATRREPALAKAVREFDGEDCDAEGTHGW